MGALDIPDSGSVLIEGVDLCSLSSKKQAKFRNQKIGFVFQFHHLLPEFTAIENVAMPLWIAGQEKALALQRAGEMLEVVGLSARAKQQT